ncbi:DUF2975 domain-containing protein [Sphingomicrobium lutaoense]|uniref:DUF2975 domain-containing protein n=1 Tax=Sphingomicrobium lutaoense TaxID=515949 RepID=A0A839Z222_9SPHN|nr:DUF2975 domain-containing protein [Sphingomicrobium lutaoense]MBB3763712.1 hypothetical protein [Sphingomicrobium lutaoense]
MVERSKWLATATLLVLIAVILLFAAQVVGADYLAVDRPFFYASLLPMPLYIFAIGAVWRALVALSENRRQGVIGRLLRRVGIALFIGSLLEVFGVALLAQLLGEGGPLFIFDLTAITVGVLGAGLTIFSRHLSEAAEVRRELDEFV